MNDGEASAWCSYVSVVKNVLGNHKEENYEQFMQNMLAHFHNLGSSMSIKVLFPHSHLHRFQNNLGDFS